MGVATHLLAASHRVFWRSHAHAVQSMGRKSDGQYRDHTSRKTHARKSRSLKYKSQASAQWTVLPSGPIRQPKLIGNAEGLRKSQGTVG